MIRSKTTLQYKSVAQDFGGMQFVPTHSGVSSLVQCTTPSLQAADRRGNPVTGNRIKFRDREPWGVAKPLDRRIGVPIGCVIGMEDIVDPPMRTYFKRAYVYMRPANYLENVPVVVAGRFCRLPRPHMRAGYFRVDGTWVRPCRVK